MSAKAGAALRRSGVRIRSLGTGHTSLNLIISELSSVRQTLKDSISAQQRASNAQFKWGQDEDSPAIRDVLAKIAEVDAMWIEAQKEYLAALKDYKRTYEHILESERKLDAAKKQLANYEDKERKYEKELSKGSKDPEHARRKLKTYKDAKSLAESEVIGQEKETVAVKLMSVKTGLLDHSREWSNLARVCSQFAECHKNLALLIPEVSPQTDKPASYTGGQESRAILRDLRSSLSDSVPSYTAATGTASMARGTSLPSYYSSSSYNDSGVKEAVDDDTYYDSFDET
ncbi:PREDICTED: uncharacterized protein LOC105314343 [Amphimedon queenslandica]|uniref:F-BAR domain-containing protein n=1 Tax=Amphimedon queenslandica TaxID=400682 RepID=A0A1X7TVA0_AMPQE|nr:PREDICTED: uncharacterized protein LOC105314343 [Amphimedon queenslandica]|eukprot:XP_011406753.1 PREDICTED: uncharacterized protein LOC105314343 [Amphimedon queenslandica]